MRHESSEYAVSAWRAYALRISLRFPRVKCMTKVSRAGLSFEPPLPDIGNASREPHSDIPTKNRGGPALPLRSPIAPTYVIDSTKVLSALQFFCVCTHANDGQLHKVCQVSIYTQRTRSGFDCLTLSFVTLDIASGRTVELATLLR